MDQGTHDVLIVGAGIAGATAACLLARAGFSVALVESREPAPFRPELPVGLRVSAISPGAQQILSEAGAWRQVAGSRHCAYREMRVEDRNMAGVLEFNSGEFGLDRLGTIVENDLLQWSLWQCVKHQPNIEVFCPATPEHFDFSASPPAVGLGDRGILRYRLLVGADGAESRVRAALGIGVQSWEYGQQGIVAVVTTERPNRGLAWQRFLPGGPVAFLPLGDGTSSIVWSCTLTESRHLMSLGTPEFCAALHNACLLKSETENKGGLAFGAILDSGPRAAFPLHMQLSDGYAAQHAVLLGDAAHVVHPLAGQGLNLGLIDAAALAETLIRARRAGEDFAADKVLGRYARWRRSEAELMAQGIHGIRSLYTPALLAPVRRLGLQVVGRSWILKEAFMRRAIGRNREAPALARGVALTELLVRPN